MEINLTGRRAALQAQAGQIDILVNNLGIFGSQPALEISDDEWSRYFEVNSVIAGPTHTPGVEEFVASATTGGAIRVDGGYVDAILP